MLFISKKKLEKIKKAEYERGLELGYGFGIKSGQIRTRPMIGTKVDEEINEIIRREKF